MNDIIRTGKQLAQTATDLSDEEIADTFILIEEVRQKYAGKPNTHMNLEALRDEVVTRLADKNILATLDPAPCFYGEPPIVEIIGKVSTDPIHKYGFDHERKQFEVVKSKERKEDYYGQKERRNPKSKKEK